MVNGSRFYQMVQRSIKIKPMNTDSPEYKKAEELIEEFGAYADSLYTDGSGGWENGDEATRRHNAIKIAIQAVEFLIKESARTERPVTYWKKVIEILKTF